jgi:DNA-directed RNA polymerase subunit H (RpoH/RPB5)
MAALYAVRESSRPRIPISDLIARAVRAQYGKAVLPIQQPETMTLSKAA